MGTIYQYLHFSWPYLLVWVATNGQSSLSPSEIQTDSVLAVYALYMSCLGSREAEILHTFLSRWEFEPVSSRLTAQLDNHYTIARQFKLAQANCSAQFYSYAQLSENVTSVNL